MVVVVVRLRYRELKAKTMNNPFEAYQNKIGIKVSFLVSDKQASENSFGFIKYRTLAARLNSAHNTMQRLRRSARGCDALIEYSTLPDAWRMVIEAKYGNPLETSSNIVEQHYSLSLAHEDLFRTYRYGMNEDNCLPENAVRLYLVQASVIEAVIKAKDARQGRVRALGNIIEPNTWEALSRDVNRFTNVAHEMPTTPDSLRFKVRKYQKEGATSLISKKYGKQNASNINERAQYATIEELISQPQNLNNEQVARLYNKAALLMQWKKISAKTVAKIRKETHLETYAGRRGVTNFMHNLEMQAKRARPTVSMAYWTADGWDVELLYRKKNAKGQWTAHNRLNTVVILDPFNEYIVGYAIGTHETPALIKDAYRNAFNHVAELFGKRYMPYQLQTDNYQIKALQDSYKAVAKHFTPAKVKNSKSKVIEPFFDKFNRKYFQETLTINWSGHNVNSNKENQPNTDYLNKVQKQFPNEMECRQQVINAIEADRKEKQAAFVDGFANFREDAKKVIDQETFLYHFGQTTGYTNRMVGEGITPTINGILMAYDSFDINFRRHTKEDWAIHYDPDNLNEVLAVNAKSDKGRMKQKKGTLRFLLELKHIQPMALYDRKDKDAIELVKIKGHNKKLQQHVINRSIERRQAVEELFNNNPELETLQKLILTTNGQYKDSKSSARLEETKEMPLPSFDNGNEDFEIVDEFRNY